MKRLTLIVSGNVQKAGYRDRVIEFGRSLGLTGYADNLPDGNVKVVAEGEEKKLELLKEIADIKNALINVEKIEYSFSEATGEFSRFSKFVGEGETDARLDRAADLMKELIEVTRNGFSAVKADTSAMLEKQDVMIEKLDNNTLVLKENTSILKENTSILKENTRILTSFREETNSNFNALDSKYHVMSDDLKGIRDDIHKLTEATLKSKSGRSARKKKKAKG